MRVRRRGFTTIVALVGIAAAALLVLATAAPAGNRTPDVQFEDFPGPDEVTFGKNVAYTTSLENTESSTFTHVFFRMSAPSTVVSNETLYSTLEYASCEPGGPPFSGLSADGRSYECPGFGQIPAGADPVVVTLVWKTPSVSTTGLTCTSPATTCVLDASGAWSIKENQPGSNDTFPVAEETTLLLQPNPTKSGGYALDSVKAADCTTSSANLITNLEVNSDNRIATAVCASTNPSDAQTPLTPGLVIRISERPGNANEQGFTHVSDICIPDPNSTCDATAPVAWPFPSNDPATFIFKIPEIGFPKGEKLDVAYHNNELYTEFACTFVRDNKTKIWTVTCPADSNGEWRFG